MFHLPEILKIIMRLLLTEFNNSKKEKSMNYIPNYKNIEKEAMSMMPQCIIMLKRLHINLFISAVPKDTLQN
jgi:hypothetical protein